jgi:hypothetical protein
MGRINSATAAPAAAPLALFGIDNDGGVGIAANLLVIFLLAVWIALVFWVYADARRRLTDSVLIGSATLAALIFPFAGALVYAIVRPPETLDDAYERDLDVRAAELRVRLLEAAVKGGPGSSAHSAAVASEVSGEPQARREPAAQSQRQGQREPQGPTQREQKAAQQKAAPKAAQPRRAQESQPRRPSSERPSRGA